MAERIDDIISPKAFEQVQKMNTDINTLVKNFESSANAARLMNAALSGSNSVKTVTESIKGAANEVAKLEAAQRRLEFANSEAGAEMARLNYQISETNRLNRALAKEMTSAEGSSNKLSGQLIRLRAQFDGMSESLRKSPLGLELAKRIALVDSALKTLDSNTGRFQRNVGNYATATNSLSQVLREMPAFTYSASTGILALSNNLPILVDQFRAVKAETGSTSSALKIFAGSLMSFPNILTIAIGLFTIFSDKIFKSSKSVDAATQSLQEYEKTLERVNNEMEFNNKYIDRQTELLLSQARARGASAMELDAIEVSGIQRRNKLIDDEIENINRQQAVYENLLNLKQAGSIAVEQSEVELQKSISDLMKKSEQLQQQRADNSVKIEIIKNNRIAEESKKHDKELIKQAREHKKEMDKLLKEQQREGVETLPGEATGGIESGSNIGFLSALTAEPGSPNDARLTESRDNIKKYFDNVMKDMNAVFDAMDREKVLGIEQTTDSAKLAQDIQTENERKAAAARLKIKQEEERQKRLIVLENSARMLQEAAQIMTTLSDAQYEREMSLIERRSRALQDSYDEELKRLELSGKSKAEIEREKQRLEAQTEAQRKQIDRDRINAARKKARSDRMADIANIISGTAVAVVNALGAKPYTPANIALAAMTGAIGLANLARAIAAPLPQFAKGTQNAPGGLAEVGEKGTELVVEPDGKKFLTPNRSTIMNIKKGSKIIPNHELMNQVRMAAMVKLSGKDSVSEMDYGDALIAAVIEQTEEQKRTRRAMERMKTTVVVNDNSSFNKWVTTYCK